MKSHALLLVILAGGSLATATFAQAADSRPNIIVILSDDMGYSDIGCYGGEIHTPVLNRLAAEGIRFTQFYNTGRCCPTRASLLTGLYPHQAGMGWMTHDRGYPGYRGDLNRHCLTIGEVMRLGGYRTYAVGKWHVTSHAKPEGPKFNWPLQRGFDRYYGTITGAGSYFDPGTLTRDNTMISPFADPEYKVTRFYYTDAIGDHAVRFIREHKGDRPFFLYVAFTAAHWPMHALPEDIARYAGKYDNGYAPIRAARFARLKKMGLIDPHWDLSLQHGDWSKVRFKRWEARCMEVYAAMIDRMDRNIGKICRVLDEKGFADNTLIMFLQDNGGCQEPIGRSGIWKRPVIKKLAPIPLDAVRTRVVPKQNRAGVPTLQGPHIMPGPEDTYIAYGINWANVSNTPFREYKHFVHEGGISTPLIAWWPKGIHRHGELERQPGHLIDIMATCIDLGKVQYPKTYHGQSIRPPEGVSLVPAFSGKPLKRAQPLFWEHEGNRAVRDGHWKLVAKENRPWELYDMRADRTEMHDLAAKHPEIVARLAAAWQTWAKRAEVLPLGAWHEKQQFSQAKRFMLRPGQHLARKRAPNVAKRPLTIKVVLEKAGHQGILVAQGGSNHGYALLVQNGRIQFLVRRERVLHKVVGKNVSLKAGSTIVVVLDQQGKATISVDERDVGSGQVGLVSNMPLDGLDVGQDRGGLVGTYENSFPFDGKIKKVAIQL